MEKINDPRLTPTMEHTRNGEIQLFRERNPDDRTFLNDNNCNISLKHDNRAMYAKLIGGEWYWVNGCGPCNGEPRSYKTYIECDIHNVCKVCSTPRKKVQSNTVWGSSNGWTCSPCYDKAAAETRKEAFEKFNTMGYTDDDFDFTDDIKCPHCASEISQDDMYESQTIECGVCEGEISLTVHYIKYFSTEVEGERVTS